MKKVILKTGFLLPLFIAGCGNFQAPWNSYSINRIDEPVKSYEINSVYKTSTGSPMISAVRASTYTDFQVIAPDAVAWHDRKITEFDSGSRPSNQHWKPKYVFDKNKEEYILHSPAYFHGVIGLIVDKNGFVPENPVLRIDKKGATKRYPIALSNDSRKLFHVSEKIHEDPNNFKFELIYTGNTKGTINLVYREYIDNLARSSFFQNLTYDLKESNTIKFKSIEIEILDATNSEVKFKVISDGSLNWVP